LWIGWIGGDRKLRMRPRKAQPDPADTQQPASTLDCLSVRGGFPSVLATARWEEPSSDRDTQHDEPDPPELPTGKRKKATFQWPPEYLRPFIEHGWDDET
jgi:hypothetical protein